MKVLLTGAFGNIGATTLQELLSRGYRVRCFDIPTKANRKFARRFKGDAEIFWGDLRSPEDTAAAVSGQDVVVHLGFVIPKLSVTGVNSEDDPEWARAINVGGTANLIAAMKAQTRPARIIFTSSLHVYGRTQDRPPPRTVADPPHPIEHYAKHKVACEKMVAESGLPWTIFRLGAALPVRLILDPGMFDVPLENRIEYVHARDVATAIANALESERVWGKTWLIGGGPGCQLHQRDIVAGVLEAVGLGMVPDEAFTTVPYPVDWLDTAESQRLLHFQTRTLDDYLADLTSRLGFRRHLIRLFRPILRAWLLSKSPVLRQVPGTLEVPGT
jgi:nucleoside-diphosphate-sugar epimerase